MRAFVIALLAGGLTVGCGSKGDEAEAKKAAEKLAADLTKGLDEAAKKAGGDAKKVGGDLAKAAKDAKGVADGMAKGGPALTIEKYEALMLDLAKCEIKDHGIDRDCAQWKTFDAARKNRRDMMRNLGGGLSALGQKHIKHASPSVRLHASSLMSSLFGASKDSQAAIVAAAKSEKHPRVLRSLLRAVGSSIAKNPEVLTLIMGNAAHEDEAVRREVITSITSSWAKGTAGTLEKAIELAEKDASMDVRKYACRRLGARADEKALPLLEKLTADSSKEPKLYAACLQGLIAMWSSPVVHETPSEKAYKLTLKRLQAKPRTKDQPPWTAMSNMNWAKKEKFQQRAPWYKADELIGALSDIVADRNANWMTRTGAVDTMKKLGAKPAQFEALKTAYAEAAKKPGTDKHVYDKIVKALAAK